jgi:copper chaperone CopZ
MHCDHCKNSVLKALSAIPGLTDVRVDLAGGSASFACAGPEADLEKIRETVRDLGFEAE